MAGIEIPERRRQALQELVTNLTELDLSRTSRTVTRTLVKALKAASSEEATRSQAELLVAEIALISDNLGKYASELRSLESEEARLHRTLLATINDAGSTPSPAWIAAWAEALERNELDQCDRLIALVHGRPAIQHVAADMTAITSAMQAGAYSEALEPIHRMIRDGAGGTAVATRLGVLRTRILLFKGTDRMAARQSAYATLDLAAETPWEALALAGLAEYQFINESGQAARSTLELATPTDAPITDVVVLLGLLDEADGNSSSADERYDDALSNDRSAVQPALLRQVPARLLVRAASQSGVPPAQAAEYLRKALSLGVSGEGSYPDMDVWLELARKLELVADDEERRAARKDAASSRAEAAKGYFEAGQRYTWSGLTTGAMELLGNACRLSPNTAEYRWGLAEALRMSASRNDGTVDAKRLHHARDQLHHGLEIGKLTPSDAWVLATQSKIVEGLEDESTDPTLLLEWALTLDPDYATGYEFLTWALRRQGFILEADEVAEAAIERFGPGYSSLFLARMNLFLDTGEYTQLLASLKERERGWYEDDAESIVLLRAEALARIGQPAEAAEVLQDFPDGSDIVRTVRATWAYAAGERTRAETEFRSLWLDTRDGPDFETAGWAAFCCGELEYAIPCYTDLANKAPADMHYTLDLAEMHLVRGDIETARELFERGIDACPYPASLINLIEQEFTFVRDHIEPEPHASDAAALLDEILPQISSRITLLRTRRREPERPAARAASARQAIGNGQPLEALTIYQSLVRQRVEHADFGVIRAAAVAMADADDVYDHGGNEEAASEWATVSAALDALDEVPDEGLRRSLIARQGLDDLITGRRPGLGVLESMAELFRYPDELSQALEVIAYDPAQLWALRDGVVELHDAEGTPAEQRLSLEMIASSLPIDGTYQLAASSQPLQPPVPLEIQYGGAVGASIDQGELDREIDTLRRLIESHSGVRPGWISFREQVNLGAYVVEFLVYGRPIRSVELDGDPGPWVDRLINELSTVIRNYLPRMIEVDDVMLWLEGWDLSHRDAPAWDPQDPVAAGLQLAKLLRMLLREGASVSDRRTIVSAFNSGSDDSRAPLAPLHTLRRVRTELGHERMGVSSRLPQVALPADVETRLVHRLSEDDLIWQTSRVEALELVTELRTWLKKQGVQPFVVCTANGSVRPFVWRLLATSNPHVDVISREEIS